MKKTICILLAGICSLSILPAARADETAAVSDWARPEIEQAAALSILPPGISDFTQPISRENFCILAANTRRAMEAPPLPEPAQQRPALLDTDNTDVQQFYQAGIINGKFQQPDGVIFAPNDSITREEAAAILHRMATSINPINSEISQQTVFADQDAIADWAETAVQKMSELRIMQGTGGGAFSPKEPYTAEQAAAAMVRFYHTVYPVWEIDATSEIASTADHGNGPYTQPGIQHISGTIIQTTDGTYSVDGENLDHISWIRCGSDQWHGVYFGFSMIAHHLLADPEFSDLCYNMCTIYVDGSRLQETADFANQHMKIYVNGSPVTIKEVMQGRGNNHVDYYFSLDLRIKKEDIKEITFVCTVD